MQLAELSNGEGREGRSVKIKLTKAQYETMMALKNQTENKTMWKNYRPLVKLIELGLAEQVNKTESIYSSHRKYELTEAGHKYIAGAAK